MLKIGAHWYPLRLLAIHVSYASSLSLYLTPPLRLMPPWYPCVVGSISVPLLRRSCWIFILKICVGICMYSRLVPVKLAA
jgi:hypothetical protein